MSSRIGLTTQIVGKPSGHTPSGVSDRRLAFGAAGMTAANLVKAAIQLAMLPIMARLLGPRSYGTFALALPAVTFVLMLADGGLGNSLAREETDARAVWSSAFWAVHGLALFLAGGVIAWSFLLGHISKQPGLPALISVLSIALLFLASGVLPGARLMRQGRLHVGPVADLVATALGAGLGVVLALHAAGSLGTGGTVRRRLRHPRSNHQRDRFRASLVHF